MELILLIISFFALTMNLGVVTRLFKLRTNRCDYKPACILFGNLAVSDFLVGFFSIIKFFIQLSEISTTWLDNFCGGFTAIAVLACQETIFTIVLISIEKYVFICHGIEYRRIITEKRTYTMIIISWFLSILIAISPVIGLKETVWSSCHFHEYISSSFAILLFVTTIIIPLPIMGSLYGIILALVIKLSKPPSDSGKKTSSKYNIIHFSYLSKLLTIFYNTRTPFTTRSPSISGHNNNNAVTSKDYQVFLRTDDRLSDVDTDSKTEILNLTDSVFQIDIKNNRTIVANNTSFDTEILQSLPSDLEEDHKEKIGLLHDNASEIQKLHGLDYDSKEEFEKRESTIKYIPNTSCTIKIGEFHKISTHCDKSNIYKINSQSIISSGNNQLNNQTKHNAESNYKNEMDFPFKNGTEIKLTFSESDNFEEKKNYYEHKIANQTNLQKAYAKTSPVNIVNGKIKRTKLTNAKSKIKFLKLGKGVKSVLLIITIYTITYVPFIIGTLIYKLQTVKHGMLFHFLDRFLYYAVVLNSVINPLIYAYGYLEFRIKTKKFKGVFARERK